MIHDEYTESTPGDEQLIAGAVARASEKMSTRSKREIRRRLMAAAGGTPFRVQRLVFTRAAAAFTVTATLLGGVSAAAAASLPGDLLYSLKRGAEDVAVAMLPDGAAEQDFLFALAARRGDEMNRLLSRGASSAEVDGAIDAFKRAVSCAYGTDGVQADLGDATAAQTRFVDRIRTMAATVQASYEAAVREQQSPAGSSGSGSSGVPSSNQPSATPSIPGSGGSGSSTGSSPSESAQPGSGGSSGGPGIDSGSGSGDSSDSGAPQGSRETTGGLKEVRKP
ncbi:MAG: hypothetical protein CVT66_09690 [Actinobacteria bacterium HGW-Actinobacteria-6]|nr:MAG: hypothetical protein CVT66_09690 [Actinobacteria bacterium HGW-Actinobacteria-6]